METASLYSRARLLNVSPSSALRSISAHWSGRSLEGLPISAREYKLAVSTVRERVSVKNEKIKQVAAQIVTTEQALASLPLSARLTAVGLSQKMMSISQNLATVAELQTGTSVRLAKIANEQMQKVDDADPSQSKETLVIVDGLNKMANEGVKTGLALLNANKWSDSPADPDTRPKRTLADFYAEEG